METIKIHCRDNGRTPFQWDSISQCRLYHRHSLDKSKSKLYNIKCCSTGKRSEQLSELFPKMVKLRKENPVLVYGKYTLLDKDNPDVYAYTEN